nr:tRNA (adenosine(37)-N6)-threonylcarbamoyltransferase complex dimerization subunit type 1 TsaB [Acidobacteriota bacterium]
MRILAVETSTRAGSWAVLVDGDVIAQAEGDALRTQDQRLPHDLLALLGAHGLALADIDLFAVATGPGSFTGLRVGIATIQGLAMATGKRVVPVPTLDAIAADAVAGRACEGLDHVAVWLDGQRQEIFGALYAVRPAAGQETAAAAREAHLLMPPQVGPPGVIGREMAALAGDSRVGFAGDGAARYAGAIAALGLGDPRLLPTGPIAPA